MKEEIRPEPPSGKIPEPKKKEKPAQSSEKAAPPRTEEAPVERKAAPPASEAPVSSVALDLETGGGFRLELVLRAEAQIPGVYPFVMLGSNGRYARVHLARVVNAEGTPLRHLALKLQRDRYDLETDRGNMLSNVEIDQLWEEEFRNLRQFREDPDSPVAALLSEGESLRIYDPLIYCRKRQLFFRPPCPDCGLGLRDCEDDSLLTRRDLPRYSQSNIRYLHCQDCHRANADAPLYRFQMDERERRSGVQDFKSLLTGWRGLGQDSSSKDAAFICQGCEFFGECYQGNQDPVAAAGERLTPFSFFRFRCLPLDVLRLHYDEFADCLGGIGWSDFLNEHRGNREGIPERLFLSDFRSQLERPDRFLFAQTGGQEATEVFRLKLVLFLQLCRRVHQFHRRFRKPNLDLKPENVMVDIPPISPELPFLWNFQVKLIDLAATTNFSYGDPGGEKTIPAPPVNYSEIYTSPIIRYGQFGHLKPCDIQFVNLSEAGNGRHRVSARLRSPDLIAEEYTDKDVFRISVNQVEAGEPFMLWASKVAGAEVPPGAMEVVCEPSKLKPGNLANLQYIGNQWLRGVNFETYHAFSVPCDLYSLGVILLRTLLSGKQQNMAVVSTKVLQPVLNELQRLRDSGKQLAPGEPAALVREILASNTGARPEMVYWDGNPERPNSIPPDLWYSALVLGVRMCTNFPAFSYCQGRGDYNAERPQQVMETVLADLERLSARIHSSLFSREELNREVREAVQKARARLGGKG